MAANIGQANALIAQLKQAVEDLQQQNKELKQHITMLTDELDNNKDKFYDC